MLITNARAPGASQTAERLEPTSRFSASKGLFLVLHESTNPQSFGQALCCRLRPSNFLSSIWRLGGRSFISTAYKYPERDPNWGYDTYKSVNNDLQSPPTLQVFTPPLLACRADATESSCTARSDSWYHKSRFRAWHLALGGLIAYPEAQNSPKALCSMVFGPNSLKVQARKLEHHYPRALKLTKRGF